MLSGLKVELEGPGCCLIAWALWPGRVWVAFAPSRVHCLHLGNGNYRDPLLLDCGCSGAQTRRELSNPGIRKPNSTWMTSTGPMLHAPVHPLLPTSIQTPDSLRATSGPHDNPSYKHSCSCQKTPTRVLIYSFLVLLLGWKSARSDDWPVSAPCRLYSRSSDSHTP